MTCFLRHNFGPWHQYEERSAVFATATGMQVPGAQMVETRQYRTCSACSKVQDEWIKSAGSAPYVRRKDAAP